ncbi:GNAT domain-containing protein [Crucibulum laeve]|uniref:GNAT domain-containing protein n=1 Tax=Crucibulum laeve TaxID=68775 RepID=A0A5C3LI15_9AGAR|nr:GNAT domain-containing protein [Crucibulum laeve]
MKANINTVLVGDKVILVPYRLEHVPKYHEWMLDEELRNLTASEPLSLKEEYEMQEKWQVDEDKLTFIILAQDSPSEAKSSSSYSIIIPRTEPISPDDPRIASLTMIGDVNIFLHGTLPSSETAEKITRAGEEEDEFEAEVEIMIAEPAYRRGGRALEGLQLMLTYATGVPEAFILAGDARLDSLRAIKSPWKISPNSLVTRISDINEPSIRLFEKLGFQITKRVEVFSEIEMRWRK